MAYIATGTHNDSTLSASEKAQVAAYQQAYNDAKAKNDTAGMAAAHAGAESVRANSVNGGYSGGDDGSGYIALSTPVTQQVQQVQTTPTAQQTQTSDYDLSEYLRQQQAAQTEASLNNLQNAYENSMRGYEQTEEMIPETYSNARNLLAAQKTNAQRNFDERAVASGLSSGTTAQSTLARDNAYLGGITDINTAEAQELSDLALEKANLQADYENAIATAKSEGDAALADALYNELIRVQGMELSEEELAQSEAKRAQELALEYGLADPTGLSAINSLEDLTALRNGTTTDTTDYSASVGTAQTGSGNGYDNGGLTTAQIKEMQKYYGTNADGLWGKNSTAAAGGKTAQQAWAEYSSSMAGKYSGTGTADNPYTLKTTTQTSGNYLSSSEALKRASAAGSTATAQVAELIALHKANQISDKQLTDLQNTIIYSNK